MYLNILDADWVSAEEMVSSRLTQRIYIMYMKGFFF